MKKAIFIILMVLGVTSFAQNSKGESNNISVFSSPGAYSDGFNIGVNYEYQNRTIYVGPEIFYFPDLNNITYAHVLARFGFNYEFGYFTKWRPYVGTRLGVIYREGGGFNYANIGGEMGGQVTFANGVFFRLAGALDARTDSQLYSSDDYLTRYSTYVSFGIRF